MRAHGVWPTISQCPQAERSAERLSGGVFANAFRQGISRGRGTQEEEAPGAKTCCEVGKATCQCRIDGCHCDGIADLTEYGYERCACCIADCPGVHDFTPRRRTSRLVLSDMTRRAVEDPDTRPSGLCIEGRVSGWGESATATEANEEGRRWVSKAHAFDLCLKEAAHDCAMKAPDARFLCDAVGLRLHGRTGEAEPR
jgi:hypothetical protein